MAKGKQITKDELSNAIRSVCEAVSELQLLDRRISNGHINHTEIDNALEMARDLVVMSRNCSQFSLRLFMMHDMCETKRRTAEMVRRETAAITRGE